MVTFKRLLAVVLVALGFLVRVYRSIDVTQKPHRADLGPAEIKVKEMGRIHFPAGAGIALVAAGTGLLLMENKK